MDLLSFLSQNNFDIVPVFNTGLQRFQGQSKKSNSGWYIGWEDNLGKCLLIGDWASGENAKTWFSSGKTKKDPEVQRRITQAKQDFVEYKLRRQIEAAAEAEKHFSKNKIQIGAESFDYCIKKQITDIGGADFCEDQYGLHLCIPIVDVSNKMCSLQKIYSDGHKIFLPGGKIKGGFFVFGTPIDFAYVCEGFATGSSIFSATKQPVIVAFNAGNLSAVISDYKLKYPNIKLVIAADNDQFSKENAGLKAAQKCKIDHGIDFISPKFNDGTKDKKPTDFNDLYILCGSDEVKRQLDIDSIVIAGIQKTDEYLTYKNLFEMLYPTAKKCLLTKNVTYLKGNDRLSVVNEIKTIRANSHMAGLPKANVDDYLDYWMNDMRPELLIDIPKYDGRDWISEILSYIELSNIDQKYFIELMKQWFAGIFARLNNNHFQNKMVIIGGDQGLGKDTFIINLMNCMDSYFNSSGIQDTEIENFQIMARTLVFNISEFDRNVKMNVSQLKNMITAPDAMFRMPYARQPERVKFHTSFISTCNIDDVFRDDTGNRRFMFFKAEKINWNYPKDASGMLLAQAKHLFETGYEPSKYAVDAMDNIIRDMTPDNWESFADDIWNHRIVEDFGLNGPFKKELRLTYGHVSRIVKEISVTLGVSERMVQSFIKKNYQRRDTIGRFYISKSDLLNNSAENGARPVN